MIVLGSLMISMTASAAVLHWCPPRGSAVREPSGTAASRQREPLFTAAAGPDHNWSRIQVHLTGPDDEETPYHFVISPDVGDFGPITSVSQLWRKQDLSPLELPDAAGDGVHIALTSDEDGRGPTPAQWTALGLLVRQLRDRCGLSRVAFDDRLNSDPNARGLRVAANW